MTTYASFQPGDRITSSNGTWHGTVRETGLDHPDGDLRVEFDKPVDGCTPLILRAHSARLTKVED